MICRDKNLNLIKDITKFSPLALKNFPFNARNTIMNFRTSIQIKYKDYKIGSQAISPINKGEISLNKFSPKNYENFKNSISSNFSKGQIQMMKKAERTYNCIDLSSKDVFRTEGTSKYTFILKEVKNVEKKVGIPNQNLYKSRSLAIIKKEGKK